MRPHIFTLSLPIQLSAEWEEEDDEKIARKPQRQTASFTIAYIYFLHSLTKKKREGEKMFAYNFICCYIVAIAPNGIINLSYFSIIEFLSTILCGIM